MTSESVVLDFDESGYFVGVEIPEKTTSWTRDMVMLVIMLCMVSTFAIVELATGLFTHSLSLVADSFHMIGDAISLFVGLVAMRLSLRPESDRQSYGWHRAEVIGALINGTFLMAVSLNTILESIIRFIEPLPVKHPWVVLIVGAIGLLINIVGLFMFCSHRNLHAHHGHEHSHVNLHGVFLHILGDAFGSIVVITTALIYVLVPSGTWIQYIDPIGSVLLSLFIVKSAIPLLRHTVVLLMQSTPGNIDIEKMRTAITKVDGVEDVHELHVWKLNDDLLVGTVHVKILPESANVILHIENIFRSQKVNRTTIQTQVDSCCE
jgi:solute carrier family 30 (zinc transporter), member 1